MTNVTPEQAARIAALQDKHAPALHASDWHRDLYVRAFLAGARHTKDRIQELELRVHHYEQEHNLPDDCCLKEFQRVET